MSLKLMSTVASLSSSSVTRKDRADELLNQLLSCVQQCQKRYGGKTELATEFDTCVAGLCLTIEAVLLHGLRNKPLDNQASNSLQQVTDIISNTLHIGSENISFWPFIKNHLTKHEQERYAVLKQIWTDTGRGKAWIRSALNERSLERYFTNLVSNKELLRKYYEDWALLCDEEKNSMLPNMAAGLCSILFAISIDKPEHNCANSSEKLDKLKSKPEPIVIAPIVEPKRDPKKKRKVAKQIISFEDDDSILSSSVPSSSSSVISDTNSIQEILVRKSGKLETNMDNDLAERAEIATEAITENNVISKVMAASEDATSQSDKEAEHITRSEEGHGHSNDLTKKDKKSRKLSIETSGTRNSFSTSIEGTLTPVQSNIGELTPISVEENMQSPTSSDDTIEVSTDISSVLSVVEKKNNVEKQKLNEKISLLTKENEGLKEQLKKYISAVQMLKNEDVTVQEALKDLEIQDHPDYRNEAKIFERKLVQVAEMHAELMDFNVLLQQTLCKKDTLLERFKSELEELRGPVPAEYLNEETRSCVNVWIPSAFLTGSGSDAHHVYQIFLRAGSDEWNIYRRYAQFYALYADLKKLDPVVGTFDFPPKKSIGNKDSALVEDRRKRLQMYLRRIISHWPELSQCNSRFLLEQHLTFFKDVKEDPKNNRRSMFSANRRSPGSNSNHYAGL